MSIAEQGAGHYVGPPESTELAAGESLIERLRSIRADVAQKKIREFEMVVPGYEGALGVQYRYPWADADRVIALAQRLAVALVSDQVQVKHDEAVELVVKCCHQIVARDSPDAEWRPLDPEPDPTNPLRFNDRLAGMLSIDLPEPVPGERRRSHARFIARHVFSPGAATTGVFEGDPAISQHGMALAGWLQRSDADVDEAFAGE